MRSYKPFHPALPNPTRYFEEQKLVELREKRQQRIAAVCILLSAAITFYVAGLVIFYLMPEPV